MAVKILQQEIVSLQSIPHKGSGKWKRLFGELELDKAIKLTVANHETAVKARNSILGSFRQRRRTEFTLHSVLYQENSKYTIYIWKMPVVRNEDQKGKE